jgi:hypothetical protein
MVTETSISVHEVDSSGRTGARLGGGSLINPELVLAHPPLSSRLALAEDVPHGLRLAIASSAGGRLVVEAVDVDGWHIAQEQGTHAGEEPLVGIEPARAIAMPAVELRPVATTSELVDAARAHLVDLDDSTPSPFNPGPPRTTNTDLDDPGDPWSLICKIFPGLRKCKKP